VAPSKLMNTLFTIVIPCTSLDSSLYALLRSIDADVKLLTSVVVVYDSPVDSSYLSTRFEFSSLAVSILTLNKNAGASVARNLGAVRATTPWIAFFDSDDLWLRGRYQAIMHSVETHPAPLIVTAFYRIYAHLPFIRFCHLPSSRNIYLSNSFGGASSVIVRKAEFLSIGGFTPGFSSCQDWDFFLRFIRLYPYSLLREPSFIYYQNQSSLTKKLYNVYNGRKALYLTHRSSFSSRVRLHHLVYLQMLRIARSRKGLLSLFLFAPTKRFLREYPLSSLLFLLRNR